MRTQFWDMHSGGMTKEEPYQFIYIEADEERAKVIFYNRFGHSADQVTCTCCGPDYSVSESPTLEQATAYHRGCAFDRKNNCYVEEQGSALSHIRYRPLDQYLRESADVLVIRAAEVKPGEDQGEVPEQGYVWRD